MPLHTQGDEESQQAKRQKVAEEKEEKKKKVIAITPNMSHRNTHKCFMVLRDHSFVHGCVVDPTGADATAAVSSPGSFSEGGQLQRRLMHCMLFLFVSCVGVATP